MAIARGIMHGADSGRSHAVRPPIFARELDNMEEASSIMVGNDVERLPVVKDGLSGICAGIITSTDIARSLKNAMIKGNRGHAPII